MGRIVDRFSRIGLRIYPFLLRILGRSCYVNFSSFNIYKEQHKKYSRAQRREYSFGEEDEGPECLEMTIYVGIPCVVVAFSARMI